MATQVSDTGSKTRTRAAADELAVIAQRAQAFTNASGTAIALNEGGGDEIVCRARSGASAPEVGTALRVEGSFTGLCIQSGKELRCDDAETDTRVDTAAIRALGIRSMVVTPIKEENRVVGVLAVFAPTAHAFTITHVAVLKTMADQIAQLLQKERRGREEGREPEPVALAPVTVARPISQSPLPSPVVIKPAVATPSAPRVIPPAAPKVEPIRASAVTVVEPLAAPVAPRKEERRSEPRSQEARPQPAANRASFGTFDAVAAEDKKSGNRWIFMVAAVVVVGAIATFGYIKMRKPAAPRAQAPAVTPAPVPAAPATPVNTATSGSETSASAAAPIASASKPAAETADSGKRTDKSSSKPSPAPPDKESKRTPETVALSSAPSHIVAPRPDAGQAAPDADPSLTVGGAAAPNLNSLATPAATSTPSMLAQSTLESMKIVKRVAPVYPPVARQRLLSATVVVEALVNKDGKVVDVKMLSGSPIFREAAFDAVKQWVYQPARLNGQPIEQKTTIQLTFKP